VTVALVLVALVLLAGFSAETGLRGAIALAAVAVVWFLVNGRVEGPTLVTVAPGHGLTGADLAGIAAMVVAAWRGVAAVRGHGDA
jgi:hypothetical protein